jgi:hypothetical protein
MRHAITSWFSGLSAVALALACRSATAPEPVTRVEPPRAPAAPHSDAGAVVATEFEELAQTTIELDGKPVRVTKADVDALARALRERIPQSPLEPVEIEVLLARTFSDGAIDLDGTVRIGNWVLMDFFGDRFGLLFRFLPPDPAKYTAFFAPVTLGASGLQVGKVERIHFHPPRHPQH